MKITLDRIAINPLQWIATDDGWIDPTLAPSLDDQLRFISGAGIRAVHSAVPAGMTSRDYAACLKDHGLAAAPGYIAVLLSDDPAQKRMIEDRIRKISSEHAELDVPTVFLAMGMDREAARVRRPGVGYDFDADRLNRARDLLASAAETVRSFGITPALHPHVGTWVETDQETRFVLDSVDSTILAFGPDMGHLAWAGADPAQLIRDYADRVAGVHVKDYQQAVLDQAKAEEWDYRRTVRAGIWAEPGQGSNDLDGVLAALPANYDGWLVMEVDRGAQATPEDSVRLCAEWAAGIAV